MNFTPKLYHEKQESSKDASKVQYQSVKDYMATKLIVFTEEQPIGEAIEQMLTNKISGGPVLDEKGDLVGMLSEKDCLKVILESAYHNQPARKGMVKHYMDTEVKTIGAEKHVLYVANEFITTRYRRFPVMQNGKLIGQVSRSDILQAAQDLVASTW